MGFFKSLFGGGSKPKPSKPASIPRATFTPVGDAEFTLVSDELPLPNPQSEADEDAAAQRVLENLGADERENAFLGGEVTYVTSSNVSWIQYLWKYPGPNGEPLAGPEQNEMFIGFHDGSVYQYENISFDEALSMYRASSHGTWVWDNLRVRKTVFGFKKDYRLVSGTRLWDANEASRARHEAIPPSGETPGYHPFYNYKGAPGRMGAKGINLGKKGSKKVAYFTPTKAKTDHVPRTKKP